MRRALAGFFVFALAFPAQSSAQERPDIKALSALVLSCRAISNPTLAWREPFRCVQEIAAYGEAATPFGARIANTFLSSKNGMDRADGASLLGYVGYTPATSKLIVLLGDKDWRVVYASARALGWLHATEALPALNKIAASHWHPLIRDMAQEAKSAIEFSAPFAKPPVRSGIGDAPASVDLDVDGKLLGEPKACASNVWQWQGSRIVFPEKSSGSIEIWDDHVPVAARGRLPAGALRGTHAGEYAWLEFKPRLGNPIRIGDPVNGITILNDAAIAVLGGVAYRVVIEGLPDTVEELMPGEPHVDESMIFEPDFTGVNYAVKLTRDARGVWHSEEIARFVRGAGVPVTFGPNLFAAGFDGEVVVFSPDGILGLADCTPGSKPG